MCQKRSYRTFLTLTVWLLTAQDLLLPDSGEEEAQEGGLFCLAVRSNSTEDTCFPLCRTFTSFCMLNPANSFVDIFKTVL